MPAVGPDDATQATHIIYPYRVSRDLRLAADYRALCADSAFAARFIDEVSSMVERKQVKAFSFDVFDTSLMRRPHSEARRFHTVSKRFSERHAGKFTLEDVLVARATAARALYTFALPASDGTREGTLDRIAALACSQLGHPALASDYIDTELAFELESLDPNPMILALLKAFPAMPVIFLSDMYIGAAGIAGLLQRAYGAGVAVISSADGHGSKRAGGLYDHASALLGIDGANLLHVGDSLESDYRQAKRKGWNAFYLPLSEVERAARKQCHVALAASVAERGVDLDALLSFNC